MRMMDEGKSLNPVAKLKGGSTRQESFWVPREPASGATHTEPSGFILKCRPPAYSAI